MGEDAPSGEMVARRASFNGPIGRLCALVSGVFVLATVAAWTLYYFLGDLADGHLDGPWVIGGGLYTSFAALFFVGVPTAIVVAVVVQFCRQLPIWAFSGFAAVGLMLPLSFLVGLASYVSLRQLLTQAAAQVVTCMFLIYQVSRKARSS